MAKYIIDPYHRPPLVVNIAIDPTADIAAMAQQYATQTGRPVVVAIGNAPDAPDYRPVLPTDLPPVEVAPSGPKSDPYAVALGKMLTTPAAPQTEMAIGSPWQSLHDLLWGIVQQVEPTLAQMLVQLLGKLVSK